MTTITLLAGGTPQERLDELFENIKLAREDLFIRMQTKHGIQYDLDVRGIDRAERGTGDRGHAWRIWGWITGPDEEWDEFEGHYDVKVGKLDLEIEA